VSKPIPPSDVSLLELDPAGRPTGRMAQPWYDYFFARDRGSRGTGSNGGNSGAVWFYGTGIPANTLGLDGDFYMRKSGTSLIGIYVKANGTWA
jgi:hypothetical protein